MALDPDKGGFNVQDIFVGNYVTENNEINVDDIAEGFDRALRSRGMADKPFDVVVHSTGMLVSHSWLSFRSSSATAIVRYQPFGGPESTADFAELDITSQAHNSDKKLFFPFTATLIEVRLNREPVPLPRPPKVSLTITKFFSFLRTGERFLCGHQTSDSKQYFTPANL